MLNKSIAYRLSIYISLAVISVFIAFIVIVFLFNIRLIQENIQYKAENTSIEVTSRVREYVVTIQEVTGNVADQVLFYDREHSVEPFLETLLEKYNFINALYVNLNEDIELNYHNFYTFKTEDSTYFYRTNKPIETCVNTDPNFKRMMESETQDWSEPIFCKRNQRIVVFYVAPIYNANDSVSRKQIGEVICELSLLELNREINTIKVGENGYTLLLSREGVYLTHPREDWVMNRSVYTIPKKVYDTDKNSIAEFLKGDSKGTLVARPELLDYKKSYVSYSRIQETGWIILMIIPYSELFEPLYVPILKMLFFSVLGILVIYILITYISNRQIQPLSSLTSELKRFSDISGETYAGQDSINEVIQVSESLNLIKSWYEKNRIKTKKDEKLDKLKEDDIFQAAEIQQSLIKGEYPAFPNNKEIDLFASYKPARVVSGDLFDYFFRDENILVFTNGDVSGKGVPAAFFMSVSQTIIKSVSANLNLKRSKDIVQEVNEQLYSTNVHQFFLTLFLGILDIKTGKLTYCNAAHTSTYVLKADGKLDVLNETHGLPLGLYREKVYRESRYQLNKGDSIILYTDGVTELQDENKLQYGDYRLRENIMSLTGLSPKEMIRRIESSLKQFVGDADQNDDICILILKYNG